MSVREYIGARYIPLFSDPLEWDSTRSYEPLTVVKNQGSSYVSRQYVPEGVAITNEQYWILWADFNAQLEQYRQEVQRFDGRITANADAIADETEARTAADTALAGDVAAEKLARESADTALSGDIAAEKLAREAADTALGADIARASKMASSSSSELACAYIGTLKITTPDSQYGTMHAGAITDIGNYQIVISSPMNVRTDNRGIASFIDSANNVLEYYPDATPVIGHANSITYSNQRNTVYVAPVFDYAGGTQQNWNKLLKFNPLMNSTGDIPTPELIMAVSCDRATGKVYAYGYSGMVYEVTADDSIVEVRNIGTYSTPREYNQDFAVHNGRWYLSSPYGLIKTGSIDDSTIPVYTFPVCGIDSDGRYRLLGELDGMDFTETGALIACSDYDLGADNCGRVTQVFQILVPGLPQDFAFKREFQAAGNLSKSVNARTTLTELLTLDHPNVCNMFVNEQAGMLLSIDADISTPNTRIFVAKHSVARIMLNNHTMSIKDIRPTGVNILDLRGPGTLEFDNVGIETPLLLAFSAGITLTVRNAPNIVSATPAGTTVSFGGFSATNPITIGSKTPQVGRTYSTYAIESII